MLDHELEVVVGLVELVEEEEVCLRREIVVISDTAWYTTMMVVESP